MNGHATDLYIVRGHYAPEKAVFVKGVKVCASSLIVSFHKPLCVRRDVSGSNAFEDDPEVTCASE